MRIAIVVAVLVVVAYLAMTMVWWLLQTTTSIMRSPTRYDPEPSQVTEESVVIGTATIEDHPVAGHVALVAAAGGGA